MQIGKNISPIGFEKYITAVEIAYINREQYVLNLCVCQKKKNAINIVLQQSDLDFETCKKTLKKLTAFSLIITGKPVIGKKLARFYENNGELIQAILPDAKQTEFVGQSWEHKGQFFGGVMRAEQFDQVLTLFASHKLFAEHVYLGPYLPCVVPELTQNALTRFTTQNHGYTFDEGVLTNVEAMDSGTPQNISFGNNTVINHCIPALCACVNHNAQAVLTSTIQSNLVHTHATETKFKKRFKQFLSIGVFVLLCLVLTNYFLNQKITAKHNMLEERLALNQQALNSIQKLESEVEEKRSLVGKRSANTGPVIALMADQLANTVPKEIRLTNLEIFPLSIKMQKEKPVVFSYNKILIEGITNQAEHLDEWIKTCKKLKWIKDVALIRYVFDSEQKKGIFKLEVFV